MKRKFLFIALIVLLGFPKAIAQMPEVSTSSDPIWYYIQVQGEDERTGLVFTVVDNTVYGKAMINSTNQSEVDTQLWRFEKNGDNYTIISKSTGKKADIAYDASKTINYAALNDNPTTEFQILPFGDYFNIKATTPPTGGSSSEVYAHQANSGGSRNYVIMFVSTQYSSEPSSAYKFVIFEDFNIEYSDDQKSVWYNIINAEYSGKGITDISTSQDLDKRFGITEIETENESQQWKLVKNNDGRINFVNKVTGNIIKTDSEAGLQLYQHNLVQFTQDIDQSSGWELGYIGVGQYIISGIEADGITRYLNTGETTGEATEFDPKSAKDSGFAWIFKEAGDRTDLPTIRGENIRIYSLNKRIVVESQDEYTITNIQGQTINRNIDLTTGIYLVTVNGKTTKIFVK